jgi:hypothetical protein
VPLFAAFPGLPIPGRNIYHFSPLTDSSFSGFSKSYVQKIRTRFGQPQVLIFLDFGWHLQEAAFFVRLAIELLTGWARKRVMDRFQLFASRSKNSYHSNAPAIRNSPRRHKSADAGGAARIPECSGTVCACVPASMSHPPTKTPAGPSGRSAPSSA